MSEPQLTIRAIADGEEATVIALWNACGLTRPWNDPARDLAFARSGPASDVLVGLLGDRIVASAMVGHDGHRGIVYYLSVDPGAKRQGYGRQMMQAAEQWLLDRGIWKINLFVRHGNEPVLAFYDSLGYELQATALLGKWIDPSKKGG
ncbi:MAG: GNAT family acetyltransferase [Hyphomicrobiaceae bacterium]